MTDMVVGHPTKPEARGVNFYREEYCSEENRALVAQCRAADRAAIRAHLEQQDVDHPGPFADEDLVHRPGMRSILHAFKAHAPCVMADIGCGCGALAVALRQAGHRVVGLDLSGARLRHCDARVARCQSFAEALPLAAASVDVVLALECLEHVMDLDATLAEIRRVLRPGGTLCVSVPHGTASNGTNHVRLFDAATLAAAVSAYGFRVTMLDVVPYLDGEMDTGLFLVATRESDA